MTDGVLPNGRVIPHESRPEGRKEHRRKDKGCEHCQAHQKFALLGVGLADGGRLSGSGSDRSWIEYDDDVCRSFNPDCARLLVPSSFNTAL